MWSDGFSVKGFGYVEKSTPLLMLYKTLKLIVQLLLALRTLLIVVYTGCTAAISNRTIVESTLQKYKITQTDRQTEGKPGSV